METQINHSVRRIHAIAERTGAKKYLEIGVCRGETFLHVDLPFKVAVDPNFLFDTAPHERAACRFFPVTSDSFFETLSKDGELFRAAPAGDANPETFDLIFLDGLHTFEQTARDFTNSLRYAHDKTVWILDDTVPCDPYSAHPSMDASYEIRKEAGVGGYEWHGDVFKVVLWLHDMHPRFSYCTVMDGGNPQTIVWRAEPQPRPAAFAGVDAIQAMEYFSMLANADCFAPVFEKDFLSCLGRQMPALASRSADGEIWKKLVYRRLEIPKKPMPKWRQRLVKMGIGCIPVRRVRKELRRKWL